MSGARLAGRTAAGQPACRTAAPGGAPAVWEALHEAWRTGRTAGLATVVATFGSAPRPVGTPMLVLPDGRVVGNLSGGCVEGDVREVAGEVAAERAPRLVSYGVSDDDAFAVGLTCGGTVEVFVEPVDAASFPELPQLIDCLRAGTPAVLATVIEHPRRAALGAHALVTDTAGGGPRVGAGTAAADPRVRREAAAFLRGGEDGSATARLTGPGEDGVRLLLTPFLPPPRLLLFGANDFAAALTGQARLLGYRTTVCDARPVFATRERFPDADEVVTAWPHRYLAEEHAAGRLDARTAVVCLSHDPKFEIPLLAAALRLPLGYVGAMGSRRAHADRVARLRAEGLAGEELAALSSPIGLGLAARTPAETAVSIAAELILVTRGGRAARRSAAATAAAPAAAAAAAAGRATTKTMRKESRR